MSWGSFREEHGRLRLATPVTSPTLPDYAAVEAAHRMTLRRSRIRVAVLAGLAVLLAVALLTMVGCGGETP